MYRVHNLAAAQMEACSLCCQYGPSNTDSDSNYSCGSNPLRTLTLQTLESGGALAEDKVRQGDEASQAQVQGEANLQPAWSYRRPHI